MDGAEDRADALFALPSVPRRIRVVGEEGPWIAAVARRGFDVVAKDADAVIVDGPPAAAQTLRQAGYDTARLFSLPVEGAPVLFADLDGRNAARHAAMRGIVHAERWRMVRNAAVGTALGYGVTLPFPRLVTIAARAARAPARVQA